MPSVTCAHCRTPLTITGPATGPFRCPKCKQMNHPAAAGRPKAVKLKPASLVPSMASRVGDDFEAAALMTRRLLAIMSGLSGLGTATQVIGPPSDPGHVFVVVAVALVAAILAYAVGGFLTAFASAQAAALLLQEKTNRLLTGQEAFEDVEVVE